MIKKYHFSKKKLLHSLRNYNTVHSLQENIKNMKLLILISARDIVFYLWIKNANYEMLINIIYRGDA